MMTSSSITIHLGDDPTAIDCQTLSPCSDAGRDCPVLHIGMATVFARVSRLREIRDVLDAWLRTEDGQRLAAMEDAAARIDELPRGWTRRWNGSLEGPLGMSILPTSDGRCMLMFDPNLPEWQESRRYPSQKAALDAAAILIRRIEGREDSQTGHPIADAITAALSEDADVLVTRVPASGKYPAGYSYSAKA